MFTREFDKRFKRESSFIIQQAIPLTRDIVATDYDWLTWDTIEKEIH